MPSAIDHLVIAVPDPDAAARELEEELGIAFTSGGRHPGAGTYNRIAFLGEPYLELIGVEDEALAAASRIGAATLRTLRDNPEGGLATYALADRKLERTVAKLRARGSSIGPPTRGSRLSANGETVEWVTATFETLGPTEPPFLIRHLPKGAEWSRDAIERRRAEQVPAGCVTSLAGLELGLEWAPAVGRRYRKQLGLKVDTIGDDRFVLLGPHSILVTPPSPDVSPVTVGIACADQPDVVVDRFGIRFERRSPTS